MRVTRAQIFIALSFIVALLLTLLPLPLWTEWVKPAWLVLVLIYWVIYYPEKVGVVAAFVLGMLLDVVNNVPFGINEFILVLLSFLILRFIKTVRNLDFLQLTLVVGFVLLSYHIMLYLLLFFVNGQSANFLFCITRTAMSLILWPILAMLLFDYQRGLGLENYNQ